MPEKLKETKLAEPLFGDWKETLIWSCLQGIMGNIYVDDAIRPASAKAVLGDFCFLAGKPDRELLLYQPGQHMTAFIIMVPQNKIWAGLIQETFGSRAKESVRYAIKKETNAFDLSKLRKAAGSLPSGFTMKQIDRELYLKCRENDWSCDLVSLFPDYNTYRKLGLGIVIIRDDELVSGASSYSRYSGGIEIEIDTRRDCRRMGLAYACGAALILECRKRGLYPSWDAQNPFSVSLAEKLGYHFDHEYQVFEIGGP